MKLTVEQFQSDRIMKHLLIFVLLTLITLISGCGGDSKPKETQKFNGDYQLVYKGETLIDSFQVRRGEKNGKRYQFTDDGRPLSMAWYKNDKRHGLTITHNESKNIVIKESFKEDLKHGISVTENEQGDTLAIDYYLRDTLIYSSLFSSDSGYKVESGRVFIRSFDNNQDTIPIGDTLSINVFMVPVPHTKVNFCTLKNEEKNIAVCYERQIENPFIYSEIIKRQGEQKSTYLFDVVDTISGNSLDKFKINLSYFVK